MTDTAKAMAKLQKKMKEPPKAGSPYLNKPRRTLKQAQKDIEKTASSKEKGK